MGINIDDVIAEQPPEAQTYIVKRSQEIIDSHMKTLKNQSSEKVNSDISNKEQETLENENIVK